MAYRSKGLDKGFLVAAAMVATLSFPGEASAHIIGVRGMGFAGGFMHPLSGIDHLMAMLAVGFWAAGLGGRAVWVLPMCFLSAAAGACLLAIGGGGMISPMETGIAVSLVALGVLISLPARPGLLPAVPLVAVFGSFHGYAHGVEMPHAAFPLAYAAGFLMATAMLHAVGVLLGLGALRYPSRILPRLAGITVALPGLVLLGLS